MSTPISPVADIVADMKAGRMVILVDEEDRENEGDLVIASEYATPEAINFMARYGRGLICLTLTRAHCERLQLSPMARSNGTQFGTAFTVSIEAATGVTTGISAADRARTVAAAIAPHATASDLVQPGHVFPIQAVDGGVLIRAGHTEAGCDLAAMAGCVPSSVICEIMKDDGSMARLPDLQEFAAEHGLKIGTIADLIEYRSRSESLVQRAGERALQTPWGSFTARLYRDAPSGNVHLALIKGDMTPSHSAAQPQPPVLVRVHEPLSLFDVLDSGRDVHSWSLGQALGTIERAGRGVAVLLNCGDNPEQLFAQFNPAESQALKAAPPKFDLRTYGVGAQILKDCGVQRMQLMSQARRMPSMMGYGLEVTGYLDPSNK
jgi:3,4-dihydroxy 2-butanone 4-phosphate synthase / GTP cyclohydrolase II